MRTIHAYIGHHSIIHVELDTIYTQ